MKFTKGIKGIRRILNAYFKNYILINYKKYKKCINFYTYDLLELNQEDISNLDLKQYDWSSNKYFP